jgi:hypothetical protein
MLQTDRIRHYTKVRVADTRMSPDPVIVREQVLTAKKE